MNVYGWYHSGTGVWTLDLSLVVSKIPSDSYFDFMLIQIWISVTVKVGNGNGKNITVTVR